MKEAGLRLLAERGGISGVSVKAVAGGYAVQVETGKGRETLTLQRGGDRVFKTLDAAALLLCSMDLGLFTVAMGSSVKTEPPEKKIDTSSPQTDTGQGAVSGLEVSSRDMKTEGLSSSDKSRADPRRVAARAKRKKKRSGGRR